MLKIRFEKTFSHSPSVVFAAFTDSKLKSKWDTEVITEHLEPSKPMRVGSKLFQTRQFMGQRIKSVGVVHELELDRLLVINEAPGEQHARGRIELEPVSGSGCKMVKYFELDVPKLIAPLVAFGIRQSLKSRYRNLERLLDAQITASRLVTTSI